VSSLLCLPACVAHIVLTCMCHADPCRLAPTLLACTYHACLNVSCLPGCVMHAWLCSATPIVCAWMCHAHLHLLHTPSPATLTTPALPRHVVFTLVASSCTNLCLHPLAPASACLHPTAPAHACPQPPVPICAHLHPPALVCTRLCLRPHLCLPFEHVWCGCVPPSFVLACTHHHLSSHVPAFICPCMCLPLSVLVCT
jgi:hypothetical protein